MKKLYVRKVCNVDDMKELLKEAYVIGMNNIKKLVYRRSR